MTNAVFPFQNALFCSKDRLLARDTAVSRYLAYQQALQSGTGSVGEAGGQALSAKPGAVAARLAAILKPAGRVRVLGVVLVPARC